MCGKIAKTPVVDPRFDFEPKCIDWTSKSPSQPLTQTQKIVLEPSPPLDSNETHLLQPVTFDLPKNDQILLPGNGTRLYVEGIFEKKSPIQMPGHLFQKQMPQMSSSVQIGLRKSLKNLRSKAEGVLQIH